MRTPLNPPASYDRSLFLTTMHYRAPTFGTVDRPDTLVLARMRDAGGAEVTHDETIDASEVAA